MNRTAALGLVAFGIVLGAVAAPVALVVLLRGPTPAVASLPLSGMVPEAKGVLATPPGEASAAAIAAHPFWRVKTTARNIEEVVRLIREQQSGALVAIDDHGRTEVLTDPVLVVDRREVIKVSRRGEWKWRKDFSDRWVYFDTSRYSARPSREQVLGDLRSKLDVEDYRGKP